MTLTLLGSLLIISSIAISALLLPGLRSRGARSERRDVAACREGLMEIAGRRKLGVLSDAEADAERLALFDRTHSSGFEPVLRRAPQGLMAASAAFLFVSGFGAIASSYGKDASQATNRADAIADADDSLLAPLKDYAQSIASKGSSPAPAAHAQLPDMNTLIERLAARLEANPKDVDGWRLLGRSYLHTVRYAQAASAFGRALELDPGSADLKRDYEEAKTKVTESANSATSSPLQTGAVGQPGAR